MFPSTISYTQIEPIDFLNFPKVDTSNLILGNDINFFLLKRQGDSYIPIKTFFNEEVPKSNELRGEYWLVSKRIMKELLSN